MSSWKAYSRAKTLSPATLKESIAHLRAQGKTIATLNGSFDLLHAGHLFMLFEAAQSADILIVAVNSDASVRAYKGAERPIIPLAGRMEMLTALSCVDYVTWFDETDPCALLETICPNVHVNGEEYGQACVEADTVRKNGGRLHLVKRIPGLATSEVIEKIQKLDTIKCD